jgi:prepilin-type N-terminal cleavage/methylation domain-containing protein
MKTSNRAFTLVEVLVVIAIIGVLIALLLPAIHAAREAARRLQCGNNIKQVALGLLNYESAHKSFPPSSTWPASDPDLLRDGGDPKQRATWVVMILPFVEHQNVYDSFDFTQFIGGSSSSNSANIKARGTTLSFMRCSSDTYAEQPFNGTAAPGTTQLGDGWARGNYAANAALGVMENSSHCGTLVNGIGNCCALADSNWKLDSLRGMMGANTSVPLAKVRDGASHTIIVGEIRAGIYPADNRGVWALGGGSSSLWAHGSFSNGDANGPNHVEPGSDNVRTCQKIFQTAGCSAWNNCPELDRLGMPCYPTSSPSPVTNNNQQGARSMHFGGVFVAFVDGSVHFISDSIDTAGNITSTNPQFSIWDRLNVSSDGATIDASFKL